MKNNIEVCKMVIEVLNEDGFFENEWIDENKFRPRFYKAAEKVECDDTETLVNTLMALAEQVSKDIIRENVDTTLNELTKKGLVKSVVMDNGQIGYELNTSNNE